MSLKISAADLRQITNEAISSAQRELAARKEQVLRSVMDHLRVDVIAGRQHSVAMSLKSGVDFETGAGTGQVLRADQLIGVAALVYQECSVFGPTLEYWSSTETTMYNERYAVSGFNIVLHWTDVEDLLTKLDSVSQNVTARSIRDGIVAAQSAIADKAASILGQLKDKAATQARAGKDWAIVMSLKAGADFECPSGKIIRQIQPEWLGPVAKAVWDACADFKPSFEYWSRQESDYRDEGSWTVEGVNIIIHW